MRVAVPSSGMLPGSEIDMRFGRTRTLMMYDTECQEWNHIENIANLDAAQGAGIQTAQNVVNAGAQALIVKNIGPKAYKVLNVAQVKVYFAAEGSVEENIRYLEEGDFP